MDLGESSRRHHKSKRHKKKYVRDDSDASIDILINETKVNNKPTMGPAKTPAKRKRRGRESGTSSEEERWLDAIESGKLEDVDDELKKIKPKDPKLMTARQRAMYERGTENKDGFCETLVSLPTGYKEKVMTAEAIQKAAIKSQKRKQLADEKREKDKKRTMERLLKKQESKVSKTAKSKLKKNIPLITYKQNYELATLSFPELTDFSMESKIAPKPPQPIYCSIKNCSNIKKYNCSVTNNPLCSLKCYKRNLKNIKQYSN